MPPIPIVLMRSFLFPLACCAIVLVDKTKVHTYLDDLNSRVSVEKEEKGA
jgi:hypothetical protein